MRLTVFVWLLCLSPAVSTLRASAQDVEMRPIDRATYRIVGVRGIVAEPQSPEAPVRRVATVPTIVHGSGVAIGPHLILTARHVVWGMNAWAVIPPGRFEPMAARPVFVDLERDIAFVQTEQELPHYLPLPEVRALRMSERVSVSGYPLDLREPHPAAVSGEVSRVARDGLLHLAMAVNPGNSGGPVIDAEGHIIALISARGRPEAGIEGLAIAIPLRFILEARAQVPDQPRSFPSYAADLAHAIGLLASLTPTDLPTERANITALFTRAANADQMQPEHQIIFAALGWNTVVAVLEQASPSNGEAPASTRQQLMGLFRGSVRMAREALESAPHLRRRFPAIRLIALGRTAPFRREQ